MKNQAYINNVDISTYGASFASGAYAALRKPAPEKELVQNKSRLEHGKRVVATSETIKKDERNVNLPIWIIGSSEDDFSAKFDAFMSAISGQFELKVPKQKTTYKLVYKDCPSYVEYGLKKAKFTLKLEEPNPDDRIAL
ncbi:MAG: hypothetical protein ACRCUJ_06435 [Phocaeicola sp.]